jgi:hypothetical protein
MNATGNSFAVLLAYGAPLLGIPVFLLALSWKGNSWNFPLLFSGGLFMLGAGLIVPLFLLSGAPVVRQAAMGVLRMQGLLGAAVLLYAIVTLVAMAMSPQQPTGGNPMSEWAQTLVMLGFAGAGFLLPLAELAIAIIGMLVWSRR